MEHFDIVTVIESERLIYDLKTLEEAILEVNEWCRGEDRPFWRGHGNNDWDLRPKVFRPVTLDDGTLRRYHERSLLWNFMARGSTRVSRPPSIDDRSGWIMIAQHFGLPTRLLDWSYSVMVALYFAVDDKSEASCDGCLWALRSRQLNGQQIADSEYPMPMEPTLTSMLAPLFNELPAKQPPDVFAFNARENDSRMLIQQAAFTAHNDDRDLKQIDFAAPILRRFIIPQQFKAHLRHLLFYAGTSRLTLFPDLGGLAQALMETEFVPLA